MISNFFHLLKCNVGDFLSFLLFYYIAILRTGTRWPYVVPPPLMRNLPS